MTFTADVFKNFDVEGKLRRMLQSALGINLAIFDDGAEPRKVFVVLGDDNLKVWRVESRR